MYSRQECEIFLAAAETPEFKNVMRKRSAQEIDFFGLVDKGIEILRNNGGDIEEQIVKSLKNQGLGDQFPPNQQGEKNQ